VAGFPAVAASWVTKNCLLFTAQTHALLVHLAEQLIPYADEYLALSVAVDIGEQFEDFVEMYKVNRHWILNKSVIFESIKNCPP